MSRDNVVVVCRPGRASWAVAALMLAAGVSWVLTSDDPVCSAHGSRGLVGVSVPAIWLLPVCVVALGPLMWLLRTRRSASHEGFAWRSPFGRTQRVPWSSVVAVRTRLDAVYGERFEVELADGRIVHWHLDWSDAKRLQEYISGRLVRGAYRSTSDDVEWAELHTYGAAVSRALWWYAGLCLTVVLGVPAAASFCFAHTTWALGDQAVAVLMLTITAVSLLGLFSGLRSLWNTRRAWRSEVLALDGSGLRVLGGETPLSVPWDGVLAIVRDDRGTRLDTVVGAIEIDPGVDDIRSCLRAIERHVSPSVLDAWRRENGPTAIEIAPGVHRHLMRNPSTDALLVLLVGVATTPIFSIAMAFAFAFARDDQSAPMPDVGVVVFGCVSACLALLAWMSARRSYVEVTEERCVLQSLVRQRSFAWAEVVGVQLPSDTHVGLTFGLRCGARLWCPIGLFADCERLLDIMKHRVGPSLAR